MLTDRPAEADDPAVPGHWEGDLILGKGRRSAVGTLVAPNTRLVLLLHLENGRSADSVEVAMRNFLGLGGRHVQPRHLHYRDRGPELLL